MSDPNAPQGPDPSAIARWVATQWSNVLTTNPASPNQHQERVLRQAGYTRTPPGMHGRPWKAPDGTGLTGGQARNAAREIIREQRVLDSVPQMPPGQWDDMVSPPPRVVPPAQERDYIRTLPQTPPGYDSFAPGTWTPPPNWDVIARVPAAGGVLASALPWLIGAVLILFPSKTADDDVWSPQPRPQRKKRGHKRPVTWQWPTQSPDAMPRRAPDRRRWPRPDAPALPRPRTSPAEMPNTRPTGTPWPSSRPSTTTAPGSPPWFDPLMFGIPLMFANPARGRLRITNTDPFESPIEQPAAMPQFLQQPAGRDTCECPKTKKKKKKDSCTNPILQKRKGVNAKGQKTITTTRLDKCQA